MNRTLHIYVLSMVVVVLLGCGRSTSEGGPGKDDPRLAELAAKREAHERELKQMDSNTLVDALTRDAAQGVEPFNSTAYREITSRGAAAAPELQQALEHAAPTASELLGLLALRAIDRERYRQLDPEFRIGVLVDALRTSQVFNSWGIPHLFWEDAAEALIEEGAAADPPLRPLLADCRPAPVWGSEGAIEQRKHQYRLCDYALALLSAIHGEKVELSEDPKARDVLIERQRQVEPVR
jgi:hypothetical protein